MLSLKPLSFVCQNQRSLRHLCVIWLFYTNKAKNRNAPLWCENTTKRCTPVKRDRKLPADLNFPETPQKRDTRLKSEIDINFSGTKVCTGEFAPPEPEFRPEFWETNFGWPNFGPEFLGRIFWLCFFLQKRPPEKFTLEKFTSQNSRSKIQSRNRTKKFTLHLCRTVWLIILEMNFHRHSYGETLLGAYLAWRGHLFLLEEEGALASN